MKNLLPLITSVTFLISSYFISPEALAESAKIVVENSYARESIPGTSISSAYMTLNNLANNKIRFIAATSAVSDRIEIHQHTLDNGMMRMRQVDAVEISANGAVIFQPSGFHLMLFDLKRALKAEESIIITLHFDDDSSVDVNYNVKGIKQKKHHNH